MNNKAVISAFMAITLGTSGFAFGEGNGNRTDRGRDDHEQRGEQRGHRDNEGRQSDRRHRGGEINDEHRHDRGAGPNHEFHRGERLPGEYRHRQYVVDDWRGYNLSAPPRGYQWVQTGSDYVLISIGTGVIAQIFLNR